MKMPKISQSLGIFKLEIIVILFQIKYLNHDSSKGIKCLPANIFRHNTFATGGSDGFVNIWDGFNKKRLCQVHKMH